MTRQPRTPEPLGWSECQAPVFSLLRPSLASHDDPVDLLMHDLKISPVFRRRAPRWTCGCRPHLSPNGMEGNSRRQIPHQHDIDKVIVHFPGQRYRQLDSRRWHVAPPVGDTGRNLFGGFLTCIGHRRATWNDQQDHQQACEANIATPTPRHVNPASPRQGSPLQRTAAQPSGEHDVQVATRGADPRARVHQCVTHRPEASSASCPGDPAGVRPPRRCRHLQHVSSAALFSNDRGMQRHPPGQRYCAS